MQKIEINVLTGEKTTVDLTADEILALQAAEANRIAELPYDQKRANEYPDFRDYLDGIVKNDQKQIQDYIDACNAVKAKYPKP
jgi:hypothetical protein